MWLNIYRGGGVNITNNVVFFIFKKTQPDEPVLTRPPLQFLTMLPQRGSPSGSVRFPPYATGS